MVVSTPTNCTPIGRGMGDPDFTRFGGRDGVAPAQAVEIVSAQFELVPVDPEITAPQGLKPMRTLLPGIARHQVVIARAEGERSGKTPQQGAGLIDLLLDPPVIAQVEEIAGDGHQIKFRCLPVQPAKPINSAVQVGGVEDSEAHG